MSFLKKQLSLYSIVVIVLFGTIIFPAQAQTINVAQTSGFNPADATKALQAALDSGADKVIVANVGKPWIITPIKLRSNQTVVFKSGVVIMAKKGAFKNKKDSLFTAKGVSNLTIIGTGATWRMRKNDYANPPYTKGEWRMGLNILGCTNVTVNGLTIEKTGGDGIYINGSSGKKYSKDITIKNVICNDNYRQGISVISADNLLIENSVMSNTSGTRPMAGIDFEPNHASNRLTNIVMRNCLSLGNNGSGYELHLTNQNPSSKPISIKFINCRSIGNKSLAVAVVMHKNPKAAPRGNVVFSGCSFKEDHGGISIGKPATVFNLTFKNSSLIRPAMNNASFPIRFTRIGQTQGAIGGVTFENFKIIDPKDRQPIGYAKWSANAPLKNLTGNIIVSDSKNTNKKEIHLSPNVIAKWNPLKNIVYVPYMNISKVKWLEPAEQSRQSITIKKARIRSHALYALYAKKDDEVKVAVRFGQVVNRKGDKMPVKIISQDSRVVAGGYVKFKDDKTFTFTAPLTGIYTLKAAPKGNFVRIESSTNPISIITPNGAFDLYKSVGTYYFWVPKGAKLFAVQGAGAGSEGFKMSVVRPDGTIVKSIDNILGLRQITVNPPANQTGKIWKLKISPASDLYFEDHSVKLLGIPPLLAGVPGAIIRSK